jgi:flagellar protein FliS
MYNTAYTFNRGNQVNQYLVKEIMEATPQQLLIKIYDFAIVNCQKHNLEKTNKAIQELINSLRFDLEEAKEISIGLLKLYQFCQESMRQKNYDVVYKILTELRETWLNIFNK